MRTTAPERGIALIATLLVMLLVSAVLVGFTTIIMSDQRFRGIDRDRSTAFYAAHSALEKLTADLGNLFQVNFAPSAAQLTALTTTPPSLAGVSFLAADGTSGYKLTQQATQTLTISAGPYQGLISLKTPYVMDVTARTLTSGDVHLVREMETVAIPVFQFGMFSDVDLSFFAGPPFNFGGRVHTNGNLFLAEGNGACNVVTGVGNCLTMSDKVTALNEVVRTHLSNGSPITNAHNGGVRIITAPGAFRLLTPSGPSEGSLVDTLGSALNEPIWTNTSIGAYHGNIRNGRTGAKRLDLPLVTLGGTNTDLVRRPVVNEDVTNPLVFGERFFTMAALRILLSDTEADITNLPTVTAGTVSLESTGAVTFPPAGYGTGGAGVDATHPPIAQSMGVAPNPGSSTTTVGATLALAPLINVASVAGFPGAGTLIVNGTRVPYVATAVGQFVLGCACAPAIVNGTIGRNDTGFRTPAGTSLIGGRIKIEKQDINGVWSDVTVDILNLGIASRNVLRAAGADGLFYTADDGVAACADPNPNAVIRIQRIANFPVQLPGCGTTVVGGVTTASVSPTDYWPNVLYDTREGLLRDVAVANVNFNGVNTPQMTLAGVVHYIALDVNNLRRWLLGQIGTQGLNTLSVNGYAVYFSDRRNNRNAANLETGEFGFEDIVNPADVNGIPNGVRDEGEDVNGNNLLETYGNTQSADTLAVGSTAPLDAAATLGTLVPNAVAQVNRPLFFRRALKLINGTLGNIPLPGLTVASENPVYVEGNWNANAAGFGNPHAATAVIADAVTLLSNNWNDNNSFAFPYTPNSRQRDTAWYRLAIIGGKGRSFPRPGFGGAANPNDFGTDGGAHNFLRFLEGNPAAQQALNYRGSIATFYYNRQALGTYKCCDTVYKPPTRGFNFDIDFLSPPLLPPRTPVFRDVNTLGFTQEIRPGK